MKGKKASERVQRVAEAITDGREVDWDSEKAAQDHGTPHLDNLHVIARVAKAYQSDAIEVAATLTDDLGLEDTMPTEPLFVWKHLEVLEQVGQGGFADVFRSYDKDLRREVALKLRHQNSAQDERAEKRFLEEARKLARVQHESVLVVHGVARHEGRIGLWTDFVHGKTLSRLVHEQGAYGADEAARVGIDLCCALSALHGAGVIHRDIKPSNVMRRDGGDIVLMDFGSAGEISPDHSRPIAHYSGTPLIMAPEELLYGAQPNPRTDIYALGALLYFLVTKRYPIEAQTVKELIEKHERGESVALIDRRADLPPSFVEVVERALARDPHDRYESPGKMQRALATAIGVVRPSDTRMVKRRSFRRRRLVLSLAAVLVLAPVALWKWIPWFAASPVVQAGMFRESGGFEEPLVDQARVQPKDQLFLEVTLREPMHIWIVNEDENGNAYVLFPAEGETTPLLAAEELHRLPGVISGVESNWEVSDQGGKEKILVVASKRRLLGLEREIEDLPRVSFTEASAGKIAQRGIGNLAARPTGKRPGIVSRLSRMYAEDTKDVWTWTLEFVNDGT